MINIKKLQQLNESNLINVNGLAKDAGLNSSTLFSKIKFCRELKVDESDAIENSLTKIVQILNNPIDTKDPIISVR